MIWLAAGWGTLGWGVRSNAPTIVDDQDTAQMIGHDHPFVQLHDLGMLGDRTPTCLRNRADYRVIEEHLALVSTDGDEICARGAVIVSLEPHRPAVVRRQMSFQRPPHERPRHTATRWHTVHKGILWIAHARIVAPLLRILPSIHRHPSSAHHDRGTLVSSPYRGPEEERKISWHEDDDRSPRDCQLVKVHPFLRK